ncbi:unnamed protein product [Prunus armeniaca]
MVSLRKLVSARTPLKRLRACPAHLLGWFPLGSWRVPGPPLRGSGRVLHMLAAQISRPGAPGRGDVG